MSLTATSPRTGSLPRQRRAPRHRDAACAAELELETPEDWSMDCAARHCSQACAAYRGPGWRAFEVRS